MAGRATRHRQLEKALEWLDRSGDIVTVIIPAHVDLLTGDWKPPQYADVYRDEMDIYRQIYGNRLIEIAH